MNMVIEPVALFIDDASWEDEEKKDEYLVRLITILDYIKENKSTVLWNDDYELLIWSAPMRAPWKNSMTNRIGMINQFFEFFKNATTNIEESMLYDECRMDPIHLMSDEELQVFLSLMHYCLAEIPNSDLIVLSTRENIETVKFDCDCHEGVLTPIYASDITQILTEERIISEYWPVDVTDNNKLHSLIELIAKRRGVVIVNDYSFEASFMRDITQKQVKKHRFIEQMIKRLSKSNRESAEDPSLQDELIGSIERRFRVSPRPSSNRVHYKFSQDKKNFIFLNYYADGEHDVGLR